MDHEDPAAQRALTKVREARERRDRRMYCMEVAANAGVILVFAVVLWFIVSPMVMP
jgi:hypothetical protein